MEQFGFLRQGPLRFAMATACTGDAGAACPVAVGRAGGAEPDGSARAAAGLGGKRRSVYLSECVPLWGRATTRGHRNAMEDACAAVPPFADVPVRMLASARKLDALGRVGVDASAAMHLFGVYDGHGGSEVANYCGDRIHVVLREALSRAAAARGLSGSGELGGIQELWEKAFCECFQRVDDEVSGEASRFMFADGVGEARCEPVAAHDVGSTAVVALVCSSHVIVANCGDSRVVLCRGKEPMALSVDHKVRTQSSAAR